MFLFIEKYLSNCKSINKNKNVEFTRGQMCKQDQDGLYQTQVLFQRWLPTNPISAKETLPSISWEHQFDLRLTRSAENN